MLNELDEYETVLGTLAEGNTR